MNCPECDHPMYSYNRRGFYQKYVCMGKDCIVESITTEFRRID